MRTKLRIQSLDEWELDGMEFECTLPIIKNKTIIFGAYNMNFEITDNIWYQLPEEYKRKIYNNYRKKVIKNMLVTITNITAYSFNIKFHDKLKDEIIMEEIYENILKRDEIDSTRKESPLKKANDAIEVDTTSKNIEEVKNEILYIIKQKNKI